MVEFRQFKDDLNRSNSIPLTISWDKSIRQMIPGAIIQRFERNKTIQFGCGFDTVITFPNSRRYSVELKTRSFKYIDNELYPLEIESHRYSDKEMTHKISSTPGWLYTSTSELIFFGVVNQTDTEILKIFGVELKPLKENTFNVWLNRIKLSCKVSGTWNELFI